MGGILLRALGLLRRCTEVSVKLCEHLYTQLPELSIKGASETETNRARKQEEVSAWRELKIFLILT